MSSSLLGPALAALLFSLSSGTTLKKQQTTTQNPQAVSILQQAVNALGTSPADSTATGSVTITAGASATQGTVQILTKGLAETQVQLTFPTGVQTVTYANRQAATTIGSTTNTLPMELTLTSQSPEYPQPLLAAILNDPDSSLQYVGLETSGNESLQHIRTSDSFASLPGLQSLSAFTTRDIWIDANSLLVQRISYTHRAAQGPAGITVDVYFSNYQTVSGTSYPFTIQKSLNGTPWATITIQNVAFNTGLTDAKFPVQAQ